MERYCLRYFGRNRSLHLLIPLSMLLSSCMAVQKDVQLPDVMQPKQIKTIMTVVADWQLNHPDERKKQKDTGWVHGALFTGMTAWSLLSDDVKYHDVLKKIGEKNQWQMGPRVYHADDHCVGQMYLELYTKYKNPEMIAPLLERFDYILANPSESQLAYKQGIKNKDRWWWCDALFMAPPVWTRLSAVTGDNRYVDFMNSEFKVTTNYLYDKKEHLYYRDSRYFTMRENNGKKIFWGRGNGWVIAGLARVLQHMPADYPDRQMYVRIYKEMADKLASIQLSDGMWRASLLDPDIYPVPEASSSSLICYAIAWGINQGILDEQKYLPVVTKAWDSLVKCVHTDGKLGNVQPIGFDPKEVTSDTTDLYGVGAFLLAGTEMYKISLWKGAENIALSVVNPSGDFCENKTIELEWGKLKARLPSLTPQNVAVMSGYTGKLLLSQTVDADANGCVDQLLFQDDFGPQQKKRYRVLVIPQGVELPKAENLAHSMFVPQRYDDFAWENDRIAFRMYGPALQNATGKDQLTSSGIDVWVKSVRYPILEKWYKSGDYHKDHGEGMDYYEVGPTRGCGGIGIWKNDKLYLSENYSNWKIIANGPIRTIFELTFNPWDVAGVKVSEVKRISLDLGSNLNRVESQFKVDGNQQLQVAIGIVLRDVKEKGACSTGDSWIGYWEPTSEGKGTIGCGIVINQKVKKEFRFFDGHYGAIVNLPADKKLVYYTGACWDKSGDFAKQDDWVKYLNTFAKNLAHPIILKIEK